MRMSLPAALVVAMTTSALLPDRAAAQSERSVRVEPVLRADRLMLEGGATGTVPVAGAAIVVGVTPRLAVEAEVTGAGGRVTRSYQGTFVSYPPDPRPTPTPEEFDRYAPIVRRSLGWDPGPGWSAAVLLQGDLGSRAAIVARAGLSGRRFLETTDHTVLSIPADVDPDRVARDFRDDSRHRVRGGLLLGVTVPVAVSEQLRIVPEVRFVYGGPAQVGDKYRELGVGLRGAWRF